MISLFAPAQPASAASVYNEVIEGDPQVPDRYSQCSGDELRQIRRTMGVACFFPYNDSFWLADSDADSQSVAIQWRVLGTTKTGIIRNKLGSGRAGYRDKDFPEDRILKWRMGRCDQSRVNNCRKPGGYTNFGVRGDSATNDAYCISINMDARAYLCDWK